MQAVGYFERCGYPCPSHYNPADFFLDVVSMDHRSPAAEEATRTRIADLADRYLLEGTGNVEEVRNVCFMVSSGLFRGVSKLLRSGQARGSSSALEF